MGHMCCCADAVLLVETVRCLSRVFTRVHHFRITCCNAHLNLTKNFCTPTRLRCCVVVITSNLRLNTERLIGEPDLQVPNGTCLIDRLRSAPTAQTSFAEHPQGGFDSLGWCGDGRLDRMLDVRSLGRCGTF
jgi:hypothetical protein